MRRSAGAFWALVSDPAHAPYHAQVQQVPSLRLACCDRCKFSTFGDKNQHCNLFDRGFLLWLVDRIHRGAGATLGCSGGRNCGLVENYDTPRLRFNTLYFSREFR